MHDDYSILRDVGFWIAVAIGCSAILAGAGVIDLVQRSLLAAPQSLPVAVPVWV